jgi:hypothetical protein
MVTLIFDVAFLPDDFQLTYLAQCPGTTCTGVNANTLKWVSER